MLSPDSDPGRVATWSGRVVSGVVVALLLLDAAIKLPPLQPVTETAATLGWRSDPTTWRVLGGVLIAATMLYAVPRSAVFGAILLTGFLGGAVATHARIGSPLATHTLFGVYVGIALWFGLWLRMPALRALLLPRRSHSIDPRTHHTDGRTS